MDNKKRNIFLICFMLSLCLGAANWVDIYKKGDILLKPDPTFGAKTDWYSIFYDNNKSLTVAPDGCVFVSDIRQNKIYKFNKNGNLIKSFGQEGTGPGDVLGPADLSILDDQYLVVRESSEVNRRISIFNLDGKFIDCIRVNNFINKTVALKNNKIAFITMSYKADECEHYSVEIVDYKTKKRTPIAAFKRKKIRSILQLYATYGDVYISRINDGDLLVGYSENPEITIYSAQAEKKLSFKLQISPLKVTPTMKEDLKKTAMEQSQSKPMIKKFFKKIDFDRLFPEYLPLYQTIMVDAYNNILVSKHVGFNIKNTLDFQVYSNTGTYYCDSGFKFDYFRPLVDIPISFQKNTIYCILEKEEAEDSLFRIVKVNVQ